MLPATGLGIAAGHTLDQRLDLPALIQGTLTGACAVVVTLLIARLLRVPEVGEVLGRVADQVVQVGVVVAVRPPVGERGVAPRLPFQSPCLSPKSCVLPALAGVCPEPSCGP